MFIFETINLLAIFIVLIVVANIIEYYVKQKALSIVFIGIFFGLITVFALYFPLDSNIPIRVDGRSILISICVIFYGPIAGFIALAIAILGRIYQSQQSLFIGILVLILSYALSFTYYILIKKNKVRLNFFSLILFGLNLSVLLLFLISILNFRKFDLVLFSLQKILPTILTLYPLTLAMMGYFIIIQRKNVQLINDYSVASAFFKSALYSVYDGIIIIDNDFQVKNLNQAAEAILNAEEKLCKQKKIDELFELAEFVNSKTNYIKPSTLFIASKDDENKIKGKNFIYILKNNKGNEIPILLSFANIFSEKGEVLGKIILMKDYTYELNLRQDILEREKNYKQLFDTVFESVLICDKFGKILNANEAVKDLLKIDKNKLIGSYLTSLSILDEKNKNLLISSIAYAYEGEKQNIKIELKLNENFNIICHAKIYDGSYYDKKIVFILLFNFTEIERLQKELNETIEQLERQNKFFLDRELKIIELKKEVNFLLKQQGKSAKYKEYEL